MTSGSTTLSRVADGPGRGAGFQPWRSRPAVQRPAWPDEDRLAAVAAEVAARPPLVPPHEIRAFTRAVASAARGECWIVQAGDCAETFEPPTFGGVRSKAEMVHGVADALAAATGRPAIPIGRIAGQYAKPRSSQSEEVGGVTMPVFRGHAVNDPRPDPLLRIPDANRLLLAHDHARSVVGLLRDVATLSGLTADREPFLSGRPALWTSHEALLLDYEDPQVRADPHESGARYLTSTHLPWIGARTCDPDGAHIAFAAGIANTVGVKVSPGMSVDQLLKICAQLDPWREPGRLILIARLSADQAASVLPPLAAAVRDAGHPVVWLTDPMHGNTEVVAGAKTRRLGRILTEIRGFAAALAGVGIRPGGLHLEATADPVTECLEGGVRESELMDCYETACDPRLNPTQTAIVARAVAELFATFTSGAFWSVVMNRGIRRIAIVGAGPRGLSVLERICANVTATGTGSVVVHVVDPYPPGAGQIWRTAQSAHLLMNTVSSQVTVFCDETVSMAGPVSPGPSLYEWARFLVLMAPPDSYSDQVMAEAQDLGPDDYPTRAFYGHYLEWAFRHVVDRARRFVEVHVHRARAIDLDDTADGRQDLRLDSGEVIADLDAAVMALGHQAVQLPSEQRAHMDFAASAGLVYLAPANPADVELSAIEATEPVAILGLGLTFFDYLTLLTTGRGGTFTREGGCLRYVPSGLEPRIYAGSRRGVPYHARGENQKGARGRHLPALLTEQAIKVLRDRSAAEGGLDFRQDIWPLVAKEVETEYYTVLLRSRHCDCVATDFRQRYLDLSRGSSGEAAMLDEFEVDADVRWSWERLDQPYQGRSFADTDDFNTWLLAYLNADIEAARQGNVAGPTKAALDVLRDLRNEVRLLVDHSGLSGESYRRDLERWYTPFNAFLSIGPPVRRIEEMAALIEAGVVRLLGPQTSVTADLEAGRFAMESAEVPGSRVLCTALIEARIPEPDLFRTRDRLLATLVTSGGGGAYRIPDRQGSEYQTRGLAVTQSPYHLLDAAGTPHPRRFAFGIPTEAVHWATAAGARPGVNSVTLGDADAIARAALRAGSDADHHEPR